MIVSNELNASLNASQLAKAAGYARLGKQLPRRALSNRRYKREHYSYTYAVDLGHQR